MAKTNYIEVINTFEAELGRKFDYSATVDDEFENVIFYDNQNADSIVFELWSVALFSIQEGEDFLTHVKGVRLIKPFGCSGTVLAWLLSDKLRIANYLIALKELARRSTDDLVKCVNERRRNAR